MMTVLLVYIVITVDPLVRGSVTHHTFNGHIGVILAVGMDMSQPPGTPRDTFDPSDLHWCRFIHEVQLHRNPLVFGAAHREMQSYLNSPKVDIST